MGEPHKPRNWYIGGSWEYGIWAARIGEQYIALKAGWNRPLFSERNGSYVWRLPLPHGWRLIHAKRP